MTEPVKAYNQGMKIVAKIVHYAARVLAVLFAGMLALFIGEGFDPEYGWQAGVMHAIVAAIAAGLAFLAFKRPLVGGFVYAGLGLVFMIGPLVTILTTSGESGPGLLSITNPVGWFLIIIGVVFLLDAWFLKRQKQPAS